MQFILGSASPRRKTILDGIFENVSVLTPDIVESPLPDEDSVSHTRRLAEEKCRAVIPMLDSRGPLILAASDTIVEIDNAILGKPADYEDAVSMLNRLNGRTHRVITGLTLYHRDSEGGDTELNTGHEITEVTFKELTPDEIRAYLALIEYRDKAGSYAMQEYGKMIVSEFRGSLSNIIGLPLRLFFRMTSDAGILARLLSL